MPEPTRAGFEDWVAARRPALLRTAFLLTGDQHAAEDLVQDSLIRIVGTWARIADDPEAYVRRVLVNAHVSRWRRRRWRETSTDVLPEGVEGDAPTAQVEARADLLRSLAQLSPRQRAVVVLRYYDDLSEAQIADVLGISPGTVKSHARDGLAALRRLVSLESG